MGSLLADGMRVALISDRAGFCAHTHHTENYSGWEEDNEVDDANMSETTLQRFGGLLRQMLTFPISELSQMLVMRTIEEIFAMHDDLLDVLSTESFQQELHAAYNTA